jgi:CRP-like cAMP-binding protein
MITKEQAQSFVRDTGWLSRLPSDLGAELLAATRLRIIPEIARLYAFVDPPGGLVGLVAGCLAGEAAQSGGAPHKSLLLHPGAWIGEGPVAGLDARMTGIWATRKSADPRHRSRRLPAPCGGISRRVAASRSACAEAHSRTMGLAQDLMVRGGRQRLFAILARLGGLREQRIPDPTIIDATQAEVGDIANLSRSVVSRFLQEMERYGLVRLGRSTIEIPGPPRLLAYLKRAG